MSTAPTTQLAGVFYGRNDLRVEQVPIPASLPAGEVRVRVAFTGICGSDLHEVFGGPFTCRAEGCPHPLTGETVPAILGHEFSGTVEELGEGVDSTRLKVGQKVCIEPVVSCLECQSCLEGDRALCERQIGFVGYNRPGGLQSVVNVPERHLHIVPDSVPLDIAAVAEPLSVSWHAVSKSGFKKGESVLVIGAGPIGILAVNILKARGASFVAVSEPSSVRREIAKASGADLVFNPLEEDAVAAVRKATNGGVNVAIDCAGTQRTFDAACEATRAKGRIVMVALWDKPAAIDLQKILFGEKIVTASCCFTHQDMEEVLEALASGLIKVDNLITSRIKLEDIVKKGLEALRDENHHVKILVQLQS